mmetsp:Transcript_30274/g.69662  ORF Transcript_30274/g.69662 Transcript_30274/m.69662 type:complete len:342 (+) Transcript_30274:60-1085(+)
MGASQSDDPPTVQDTVAREQQFQQIIARQQQFGENRAAAPAQFAPPEAAQRLNLLDQVMVRPVEQPHIRSSKVIQNPAHLHSKTLALSTSASTAETSLGFCIDALCPGVATVYRGAITSQAASGSRIVERSLWESTPVEFGPGMSQRLSVPWVPLEEPVGTRQEVSVSYCPVLVELKAEVSSEELIKEATLCRLVVENTHGRDKDVLEVVRQEVHCGSIGEALDILEVYGTEVTTSGDHRAECVVCQCLPRDTVVQPCRHMCLCSACAEYIRTRVQYRSYRCPMCRERISWMMHINGEPALPGLLSDHRQARVEAACAPAEEEKQGSADVPEPKPSPASDP